MKELKLFDEQIKVYEPQKGDKIAILGNTEKFNQTSCKTNGIGRYKG